MKRYWLNLKTLEYRLNDMEFGPAQTDAINWFGEDPTGWFSTAEAMNAFVVTEVMPVLIDAWRCNPELRLGQLISAAAGSDLDVFYVHDGQMRDGLRRLIK